MSLCPGSFSEGSSRSPRLCRRESREELFSFPTLGQAALNRGDRSCSPCFLRGSQTGEAEAGKAPRRQGHSKLGDQGGSVQGGMGRIRDEAAPACLVMSQYHPCPSTVPQATSWSIVPSEKADTGGGFCVGWSSPTGRDSQRGLSMGWAQGGRKRGG